jgi:hypothetical protein
MADGLLLWAASHVAVAGRGLYAARLLQLADAGMFVDVAVLAGQIPGAVVSACTQLVF